jgi:dihydrofolate reductase
VPSDEGESAVATFMRLGLIDEYRLFVHPVILGAGTPFCPALGDRIGLKLLESRTFGSGVVYLRYETINPAR